MTAGPLPFGAVPPAMVCAPGGARTRAFVDRLARTECPAFTARRARRAEVAGSAHDPIVWTRAHGVNVEDADGNVYLDLTAGFGVAALGFGQAHVVAAIEHQLRQLPQALGDLYPSDVKVALLERLQQLAPFPDARVALALSGADALDIALKTALLKTGRPGIAAFVGGYHGLSYGPLALCGFSEAFRAPFAAQLNPHVAWLPFPDEELSPETAMDQLRAAWPRDGSPGALVVEPVQARGGVRVPPVGFFEQLRSWCSAQGTVLIADEVFTGLGRTGYWFHSRAARLDPDLICLGKALGGGLPVSACLGKPEVMDAWGPAGQGALHTGTLFGHPPGCAAALTVLQQLEVLQLIPRAAEVGAWCLDQLQPLRALPAVRDVRGAGLLLGIHLADRPGRSAGVSGLRLVRALLERGYLVLPAGRGNDVLQLAPALTIERSLLSGFFAALEALLQAPPAP